ncbi:MBL fold metallo-hydrolase [Eubacterium barkeri]|uniref:7,8-dihydropterin-6-yl-methyl-4-(Beta-D-ribofuranosyl)aminobenzene 5'-phosphate synthase n=1 Tax=Eubacterium barkeri TaxID=1528 RepID=A0A1H3ES44_EUBBA|nr:MBL fold metallo-hydrolase [Eubacterium barkeri]SDX81553.1 7,8-dihydropterin-6-yl-methyl-4-(beta-D-ribofuranosyl)aminobenzene 5'-phosphate synthase [Eubacterium barkeri]
MKLTILVDNHTLIDEYYLGEPGVSYYIEDGENRVLFDTGYSEVLLSNARRAGIHLEDLTHIVLSHGHNDHTNGLRFLQENIDLSGVMLCAHPHCFLPKYDGEEFIGAPYNSAEIERITRYTPTSGVRHLSERLIFLGEIPRENDFEACPTIGRTIVDGCVAADTLRDDSALVYQNGEGIFIMTGCSHSGICNIVDYAQKVCGEERILGVLGGFHLLEDSPQLDGTIAHLKANRIDAVYPCHCVSLLAKTKMMAALPVQEVGVGMVIEIDP